MGDFSREEGFSDHVDERLARFAERSGDDSSSDGHTLYTRISAVEIPYVPVETLAVGGMKKISRVYDARADRYVAMAQLRDSAPTELYEPFLREACLTARLEHPNIISIYDIGVDDRQRPFFTMEMKSGYSLSDILNRLKEGDAGCSRQFPLEELLGVFIKVCDAVAFAHSQGVMHLDLKPSNIQVAAFGEVKVCDWGLGYVVDAHSEENPPREIHFDLLNSQTRFDCICGTPGFMAPEQIETGAKVSCRTDIYALGAVLYSILALKAPLSGSSDEILRRTLDGDIPTLPGLIPPGLRAVVRRAMCTNPELRYSTVEELQFEIRCYLQNFPTAAEVAGILRRIRLFYKRNRKSCRIALFGVGLTLLIARIFMAALQAHKKQTLEARYEAMQSQQLYVEEKEHSEGIERNYSGELLFMNKLITNVSDYRRPVDEIIYTEILRQLEVAEQLSPSDAQIRVERAMIFFILQRFNEALNELRAAENWAWTIRDLCEEYGAKKTDSGLLPAQDTVELIRKFRERSRRPSTTFLIEKLVSYDLNRRESLSERAIIVKELLAAYNPGWTGQVYDFDVKKHSLVIGGKGLSVLRSRLVSEEPLSLLRWLDLHTIKIQDVDFQILEDLRNMPLVQLDIRQVQGVPYESVFCRFRVLDELIVFPGQLPKEKKEALPPYITVTEQSTGID